MTDVYSFLFSLISGEKMENVRYNDPSKGPMEFEIVEGMCFPKVLHKSYLQDKSMEEHVKCIANTWMYMFTDSFYRVNIISAVRCTSTRININKYV